MAGMYNLMHLRNVIIEVRFPLLVSERQIHMDTLSQSKYSGLHMTLFPTLYKILVCYRNYVFYQYPSLKKHAVFLVQFISGLSAMRLWTSMQR